MGKSVSWVEADATANPDKKVYLGTQFQGVLDGRDLVTSLEKPQTVYRIRLESPLAEKFGQYVSVWETATIRSGMEEGNNGKPIPEGAIVRFTHMGMKKSMSNKSAKPYHDILIEFYIPNPEFRSAATPPTTAQVEKGETGEDLEGLGF